MIREDILKTDIAIVQKQTALERYTRRALNIDFLEYLEKAGQSLDSLVASHDAHMRARELLLQLLAERNLSHTLFNLDELQESGLKFHDEDFPYETGIIPKQKLVLSLGGDGTLLHASHYVGGDVNLLGLNSCPGHSVGHLCRAIPATFSKALDSFFKKKMRVQEVRRLKVVTSQGHSLPLGLNDLLLCNRHPAATSRYQLSVTSSRNAESEKQLSSGIWISAPAGSTAAISSYGLPRLELNSQQYLLAVREPYVALGASLRLEKRVLDGRHDALTLFCRMRQGMVCVDGPDASALLGFGESVRISLPDSSRLNLVTDLF